MPNGWTETTLGPLVTLRTGKLDVNAGVEEGGFPFFTCSRDTYKIDIAAYSGKSVIVAGNGDLNVKYYEGEFNAYQRTYILQAINESVLNPIFLFHFMEKYVNTLRNDTQGSTIQYLKKGQFTEAPIVLPPLAEQKRIVDVMSSVDAYIDALQKQVDTARAARNAVLHELLSAGGDDWTETTIGEIGLSGMFADGDWVESKDQDPAGEYRLLQLADIGDGVFLDKSDRWMNSEQFSRLRCTPLKPRDILIARMPDPIARACVFPSGLPTCATVVDVAILRCGEGYIPEFVVLVVNDSAFRAEAQSLLTGTTRQRISRSNLAKIVCKLPSLAEQKRIVEIVSSMDDVIQLTEQAVVDAKNLRSGLLSDLLSGEHAIPASYDSFLGAA